MAGLTLQTENVHPILNRDQVTFQHRRVGDAILHQEPQQAVRVGAHAQGHHGFGHHLSRKGWQGGRGATVCEVRLEVLQKCQ